VINNKMDRVTFNGNGSIDILDNIPDIKPLYLESRILGQYKYVFNKIKESLGDKVGEFVVVCPFYQQHKARVGCDILGNDWLSPRVFDYQPAVTGKSKRGSRIENDEHRLVTMRREIIEELNVDLSPSWVESNPDYPLFKFGVCIVGKNDYPPPTWSHERELMLDDYNKRVMVVVLERLSERCPGHVNNNLDCEADIVGMVRVPLNVILVDLCN
jgi:hypothetical protein